MRPPKKRQTPAEKKAADLALHTVKLKKEINTPVKTPRIPSTLRGY